MELILEWSLSSKKQLIQQLVLLSKQVIDSYPYLNELNGYLDELNANNLLEYEAFKLTEQDKLETSIKLAIAWKRSLI